MKKTKNKQILQRFLLTGFFGIGLTTMIACGTPVITTPAKPEVPTPPIDNPEDIVVLPPNPQPGNPSDSSGNVPGNNFPNDGVVENTQQVVGYPISANAYETRNSEYAPYSGNGVHVNYSQQKYQTGIVPNEQYSFINDYTVRIRIFKQAINKDGVPTTDKQSQTSGTGWFLDFLQPTNSNEYPLTWFIATNAHVIIDMKFPNNPYQDVLLPSNEAWNQYDGFQLEYANEKDGKVNDVRQGTMIKAGMKTPELFYLANNFLGKQVTLTEFGPQGLGKRNIYEDYFKDFAILKVDFPNEVEARAVTRNFATKYKTQKTQFAKKTLLTKTANELREFQDVYVLGYPSSSKTPTINKEEGVNEYDYGSQLSFRDNFQITNKFKQKLNGLANATNISLPDLKYNVKANKWLQRVGLVYSIEDDFLGSGASGSMVVNKQKEVLGIQHSNDEKTRTGYADPLISEGFTVDGKIIFPAYNLIYGGAPQQITSFQDSMKLHFKGKTSWLLGTIK